MEIGSMEYYNKLLDDLLIDLHEWTDYRFAIANMEIESKIKAQQQIRQFKELGIIVYENKL